MSIQSITIPISSESFTPAQFKAFCIHFGCTAIREGKKSDYWVISSKDPANFFWLGANMNFRVNSSLSTTIVQSILTKKK